MSLYVTFICARTLNPNLKSCGLNYSPGSSGRDDSWCIHVLTSYYVLLNATNEQNFKWIGTTCELFHEIYKYLYTDMIEGKYKNFVDNLEAMHIVVSICSYSNSSWYIAPNKWGPPVNISFTWIKMFTQQKLDSAVVIHACNQTQFNKHYQFNNTQYCLFSK